MATELVSVPEAGPLVKTPLGAVEKTALSKMIIGGDLSTLSADQKVVYYVKICERLGLDPFTRPFEYLVLNNKLVLYARKEAAEQLRIIHQISLTDLEPSFSPDGNCYMVKVKARMGGREDVASGAVSLLDKSGEKLKGEAFANALLKTETKAKRRATLSICGLGMLDETEVETIPSARPAKATPLTPGTGARLAKLYSGDKEAAIAAHVKRLGLEGVDQLSEEQGLLILSFVEAID